MEQIGRVTEKLETAVFADIDRISELCSCDNNEITQLRDGIKLNISSHLSELRFYISDGIRLRSLTERACKEVIRYHGTPVVFVLGKATHSGTIRAKAMSGAYWNESHPLNSCIHTPVSQKDVMSSTLVGVLIACTQVRELKGQALCILTHVPSLKKVLDHLPLTNAQNYKDSEGQEIKHAAILKKIYVTEITLTTYHNPNAQDAPLAEIYTSLGNFAKKSIRESFRTDQPVTI